MASLSQLIPLPPTIIEVETLAASYALELAANDIHFLTSHFSTFNLSHVCRHCNKVAHSFAKKKNLSPPLYVRMEEVLSEIVSVLQANLNNSSSLGNCANKFAMA